MVRAGAAGAGAGGRRGAGAIAVTIGPDGYYGSADWEATFPPRRPSTVDSERVGSLLDGRLSGTARDSALAEVAASDDDYDVFADTAAVLREAESEEQER